MSIVILYDLVGVILKIGDATRDLKNKTKGMGLKLVLEEAKKLDY